MSFAPDGAWPLAVWLVLDLDISRVVMATRRSLLASAAFAPVLMSAAPAAALQSIVLEVA
jgi:hypothetical protein